MRPRTHLLQFMPFENCPKCQSLARAQWMEDRQSELLDTQYFHVVFTVPHEIAAIAYQNKEVVYDILFRAAAETLRTIAADPRIWGRRSVSSAYCTVGSELVAPPASSLRRAWWRHLARRPALGCLPARLLLPVRVLSRLSGGLFLQSLQKAFVAGKLQFFGTLDYLNEHAAFARAPGPVPSLADWVVYAKPPFAGPTGARLHGPLYAPHRHLQRPAARFEDDRFVFAGRTTETAAGQNDDPTAEEFIRRFLFHVLPEGFQRIRYYGFLWNRYREQKLDQLPRTTWHAMAPAPRHAERETIATTTRTVTGRSSQGMPHLPERSMVTVPSCLD